MDNQKQNITLAIAGRKFPLLITRDKEQLYRESGKKVNEIYDRFISQGYEDDVIGNEVLNQMYSTLQFNIELND